MNLKWNGYSLFRKHDFTPSFSKKYDDVRLEITKMFFPELEYKMYIQCLDYFVGNMYVVYNQRKARPMVRKDRRRIRTKQNYA